MNIDTLNGQNIQKGTSHFLEPLLVVGAEGGWLYALCGGAFFPFVLCTRSVLLNGFLCEAYSILLS